jgi:hypothetical protein
MAERKHPVACECGMEGAVVTQTEGTPYYELTDHVRKCARKFGDLAVLGCPSMIKALLAKQEQLRQV